jgi:5-methylcytosine-specific restriction endonuclease McrA
MPRKRNMAKCHPDQFVAARGLCSKCYNRIRAQEWRDSHPRYGAEAALKSYYKNRNRHLVRMREQYQRHKETRDATTKKYKADHPDKARQYKQNWMDRNGITATEAAEKRRARMANSTVSYTRNEWKLLCAKYGNGCLACGKNDVKLTADHIIPLSIGGTNYIENIQPLCQSCNSKKWKRIIDYRPIWNNRLLEFGMMSLYPR